MFKIFEKLNPVLKRQKKYTMEAQKRGLLAVESLTAENLDLDNNFYLEANCVIENTQTESKTLIIDETIVWTNGANLNNRFVPHNEVKAWVESFSNDREDYLNVNHSTHLEDTIGEVALTRYDETTGNLYGKGEITRFENSKLQDMLATVKETSGEVKIGFSPEFNAKKYSINAEKQIEFQGTHYLGMGLVLTPSAPQTLTSLESVTEKAKEAISEDSNNITVENLQTEISEMVKGYSEQIATLETNQAELLELVKKQTETIKKQILNLQSFDSLIKNSKSKNII